ncbi:LPPG:FO 2-phospho-L-lactate transferase [Mesorhizobium sp. J18]|uniref:2-phospho-L-lactate transferase n=1 Tax=Mesorhizobium sp. J18 TaxID=935263 RepID=UPI00119B9F7A|nr:2-phospho-L-lactate transferase [Mesorhizobium sp. J18]TWG94249.1 LPPG:FO 2-phospho-L-lactate transferase [Mesorhizobium sp. J18]
MSDLRPVVALAGGVGGAKLIHGLAMAGIERLSAIVNTGDDFEHLGLHIAPDVDTVLYTLAGIANRQQGWGLEGESWSFMDQLEKVGAPVWFRLGDRDLATHVLRTERLRAGERLTGITRVLSRRLGAPADILPMSDEPVRTMVNTISGEVAFQDYFVRLRCDIEVKGFRFAGIERARPTPEVAAALRQGDLRAIVICPSNPLVSIAPILSLPGMRELVVGSRAPIVAVSPIIGGRAVKGPAAKMMLELGQTPSVIAIAETYAGLVDGLVIDHLDAGAAAEIEGLGIAAHVTGTLMGNDDDRRRLGMECLEFADQLKGAGREP